MNDSEEDSEALATSIIVEFFRSYLQQVVTIHYSMFDKLLFRSEGIPLELAELFEDAGNTYLEISERIAEEHRRRRS